MFVKVELRVLFDDQSDAEYYREQADKIDAVDDSDDEGFDEKSVEKRMLSDRADQLEREPDPTPEELYEFLLEMDEDVGNPRYLELINVCIIWNPMFNPRMFIKNGEVRISFVVQTDPTYECSSIEAIQRLIDDDPFLKSQTGGRVGNYCKFPSRVNPDDLLGLINVDGFCSQVTDSSGSTIWVEEEVKDDDEETADLSDDESEEEVTTHPYYMTHEDLFGPPATSLESVSLDDGLDLDAPAPVKKGWSFLGMLKPKRVSRKFF
jgi:hypothetical protein